MDVPADFRHNLDKCQTWFDVAAVCYDYLLESAGNENRFIGAYIEKNPQSKQNNPNLGKLRKLREQMKKVIWKRETEGLDIDQSIYILLLMMQNFDLKPFLDDQQNNATVLFVLLQAIDQYYFTVDISSWKAAPLNHNHQEQSFVYFSDRYNIMQEAISALDFGRDVLTDTLQSQFSNLRFVEHKKLPRGFRAPRVVTAVKQPSTVSDDDKSLRICLIPYAGFSLTKFQVVAGSCFKVQYPHSYFKTYAARTITLLEEAIVQKANIIIFPEYVISPELQQLIGHHLRSLYDQNPTRVASLQLVMAGSGWTDDNNNVMTLFDGSGIKLSSYYKYSPFVNEIDGKKYRENLSRSDNECTLVDLPGIGRILPAICRDVVNHEITDSLADMLRPFAVCVSAWSKSNQRAFAARMQNLANCYYCSTIICNCCEAIHYKEKDGASFVGKNGLIGIPYQYDTAISCAPQPLIRRDNCHLKCNEEGCVFIIDLDYAVESVRDKSVVTGCQQISVRIPASRQSSRESK